MRRAANNVLASKQPVTPAEAAHMVQNTEEEHGRLGVLDGVLLHTDLLGLFADVSEELAVGKRAVGAELVEDLGERS